MALTGKPTIQEPREASEADPSPALRPTQTAIANIRERLRLVEAEVNVLIVKAADAATNLASAADLTSLQTQITDLRTRVQALEDEALTDWYVDGTFIATRRAVNFVSGGNINLVGSDDDANNRAIITFAAVTGIAIEPGRLVLTGRDLTVIGAQGTLAITRGALELSGTVPMSLGMPITRGRLSLAGRTVGMTLLSSTPIAVTPGSLVLTGRTVGMAVGANTLIAVTPGHLVLTGRTVGITTQSFTFFRDFSDLSTTNLHAYGGTISAATGQLVGTPSSGSVHERVYFDLLPSGSPTSISGAFDITAHFALNGVSTALSALLFFNQEDGTSATVQNGYWLDINIQAGVLRFIEFNGGVATQRTTGALPATNGTHALRLTHDGAGNYEFFFDGVSKGTLTGETTFTSGQFGVVFFSNPGGPYPLVDYGITYTP